MKYQSMMFVVALVFSSLTSAADNDNNTLNKDEMVDYQIECLESAFGAEIDDSQIDAFVRECTEQKLASKKNIKDKNA